MLKDFRTYQLSLKFYRQIQTQQLTCHLRDQLLRAASSVCLNLAEGYGRMSQRDKCRFYKIAFGSMREVQAVLDLAFAEDDPAVKAADLVCAHLYKLIKILEP